jgi:hypothetical protein
MDGRRNLTGRTAPSNFSKPVEIGKEYIVDITDNGSSGGDGIARIHFGFTTPKLTFKGIKCNTLSAMHCDVNKVYI